MQFGASWKPLAFYHPVYLIGLFGKSNLRYPFLFGSLFLFFHFFERPCLVRQVFCYPSDWGNILGYVFSLAFW